MIHNSTIVIIQKYNLKFLYSAHISSKLLIPLNVSGIQEFKKWPTLPATLILGTSQNNLTPASGNRTPVLTKVKTREQGNLAIFEDVYFILIINIQIERYRRDHEKKRFCYTYKIIC